MYLLKRWFIEPNAFVKAEYAYARRQSAGKPAMRARLFFLLIFLNIKYRLLRRPQPVPKPYTKAAESVLSHKIPPRAIADILNNYGTVSFDIFDTLIIRPLDKPSDLFYLLEYRLGAENFAKHRRAAEVVLYERYGVYNISDIYRVVGRHYHWTEDEKNAAAEMEFAIEMSLCRANEYVRSIYERCLAAGKTIVAVSDSYFPGDMLAKLLSHCGYNDISHIYASCDCSCDKRHGLYDYYLKNAVITDNNAEIPTRSLLRRENDTAHFGDDRDADLLSANVSYLFAVQRDSAADFGYRFRAANMSRLVNSAYRGVVNARLHAGASALTPAYEYGYVCGGLPIYGFCEHLKREARQRGTDHILFLSRDGRIIKDVFDKYFSGENGPQSHYAYWSRAAYLGCDRADMSEGRLRSFAANQPHLTMNELLCAVGLPELRIQNSSSDLPQTLITERNIADVADVFRENRDVIKALKKSHRDSALAYYQKLFGASARRVLIVDVGWRGESSLGLRGLLLESMPNLSEVSVEVMALRGAFLNERGCVLPAAVGQINGYMFAPDKNRADARHSSRGGTVLVNDALFEMFTGSADEAMCLGFTENGEPVFGEPDSGGSETTAQIHCGIKDFCADYDGFFAEYPFLRGISGQDAYQPFRTVSAELRYFKRLFGDFPTTPVYGASETLRELFRRSGL